jgi:ATP-dependent Clp protease protease subunit
MKRTVSVDEKIYKVELHRSPVIVRVNKFNEEAAEKFTKQMTDARNSGQPIIPIVIDSYGGQVYSLMSMITEIQNCDLPVATIVEGKAMSCGAVLFSFGTEGYRFMSPNATVMIHDVSSGGYGKIEELKANAEEADRLDQIIFKMMSQNCGKKDDYFKKIVHKKGHADWYLDSSECKKHNLCNHIRVPDLKTEVKVEFSLE